MLTAVLAASLALAGPHPGPSGLRLAVADKPKPAPHAAAAPPAVAAPPPAAAAPPAPGYPAPPPRPALPRMALQAQYEGPLKDTIVQRWRDPVDGTICYLYLPVVVAFTSQTQGYVQYGPNSIGSISCFAPNPQAQAH